MRVLAVTNLYPTESNPALGTYVEQQVRGLRQAGVEVEVLYINRQGRGPGTYVTVPDRVRESLRRVDPDVVHVMYGGVMADLVTRAITDKPLMVTFHGSDLVGEKVSSLLRRLLASYGVICSHRAARRATGIVVVSRELWNALPASINRDKVRIIPCGIDTTRFRPLDRSRCRIDLGWPDDRFHVLFNVNGDDPVKQPALARAAVEELRRTGIAVEFQEMRGLPYGEVPLRLNAADVLLLTSKHEGSPTIVKEALACNLPVVSVDVGDVREQISGIDGCYLAAPEPGDLAAKLRSVYDGSRRVQGHVKMDMTLSIECIARRLKQFYTDVCQGRWEHAREAALPSPGR
jgi:teichuronic acid biosynthesis glycosyltransferase TuaC